MPARFDAVFSNRNILLSGSLNGRYPTPDQFFGFLGIEQFEPCHG
jgi:hypothetical protein